MWKFILNAEKPKPVLKQSEAEKRKYQLEYEKNKRQRNFYQIGLKNSLGCKRAKRFAILCVR